MTRTMKAAWGGLGVSVMVPEPKASPPGYRKRLRRRRIPPDARATETEFFRRAEMLDTNVAQSTDVPRRFEHFHVGRGGIRPIRDNCVAACASASIHSAPTSAFSLFRSFEGDNPAGGDRHRDSRLRIAPRALALLGNGEVAETAKLHVVPGDKRGLICSDGVNQFLRLTARNTRTSGIDRARDFLLGQRRSRQFARSRRSVGVGFRRRRFRARFISLPFRSAARFVEELRWIACSAAAILEQKESSFTV